jgi:hypothetical protein
VIRLDLAELDLADLTHQVMALCRPLAEHKQLTLQDRTARPAPARGDAKRLAQALNPLVVNAIKFPGPGGEITVDSVAANEPELIVSDNGVGIDSDDLPHVFDRFYRCAAADVMAVPGPGLGLAVVKSIIRGAPRRHPRDQRAGRRDDRPPHASAPLNALTRRKAPMRRRSTAGPCTPAAAGSSSRRDRAGSIPAKVPAIMHVIADGPPGRSRTLQNRSTRSPE